MLKQRTNTTLVISFDDTHNGTHHEFESDNMDQAQRKAKALLALTPSGNVVIKTEVSEKILDYYEK
jgi:hypothetical protein